MALPFTPEQFHGVFRDYNTAVWPAQWVLVALALSAVAAVLKPRPWSAVAVSAILGFLWAWIAVVYHLVFFTRISPPAYVFTAMRAVNSGVCSSTESTRPPGRSACSQATSHSAVPLG